MKWTTEKPTEPGWYWRKSGHLVNIVRVDYAPSNAQRVRPKELAISGGGLGWHRIHDSSSWSGPIPEPEDPQS